MFLLLDRSAFFVRRTRFSAKARSKYSLATVSKGYPIFPDDEILESNWAWLTYGFFGRWWMSNTISQPGRLIDWLDGLLDAPKVLRSVQDV